MALKKFCAHCGCNRLIDCTERYCGAHKKRDKAESDKQYDKSQRNKEAKAFYNSTAWKQKRQQILIRDKGIDVYVYMTECRIVKAEHVHHIIELEEDSSLALVDDNLISLSAATHSIISRVYKDARKRQQMQEKLRAFLRDFKL
jgi:hypothetical protein|nr:MAG TPA: HNH endonuclease [Caudoviricetes sp.]